MYSEENEMLFSLNCLISGNTYDNLFNVPIGYYYYNNEKIKVKFDKMNIANLKEILSRTNEIKEAEITQMNLWKVELKKDEVNSLSAEDIEKHDRSEKMDPALNLKGYYNDKDKSPKEGFLHIFIVPTSTDDRKRKAVRDVSSEILDDFRKRPKMTLPDINRLKEHIDNELDIKIPLLQSDFDGLISIKLQDPCNATDLEILFRISETECSNQLGYDLYGPSIHKGPPEGDLTEYCFVHSWDNNIRVPLELLVYGSTSIRNSSKNTSTGAERPDYGLILGNVCPFRGEEKSLTNKEDPRSELASKLIWTYDPAEYILGYYAIGPVVTLVAIRRPVGCNKPTIFDIVSSNLALRRERVYFLRRMINLSQIIESLQEVIGYREMGEYILTPRGNRHKIELCGKSIKKVYIGHDALIRIEKLKNIYKKLGTKNVPNVDRLCFVKEKDEAVYLSPRGMDVNPENQQELLDSITCVLEMLVILHGGDDPIYHQDIRWPNIIRHPDEPSKWIIIDWEDADGYPNSPASHLTTREHAPEVFVSNHRGEVDIWGVGKLILDASCFIIGLSKRITDFGRDLQEPDRPSAKKALKRLKKIKKKILKKQNGK